MIWLTEDAAPFAIGAVDWGNMTYMTLDAPATLHDFADVDGRRPGIADKGLTGLMTGSVAGLAARPGGILFVGVDNLNAE